MTDSAGELFAALSPTDVAALEAAYRALRRGLAAMPLEALRHVEPPLRVVPAPGPTMGSPRP
jgi:hypothetical protein